MHRWKDIRNARHQLPDDYLDNPLCKRVLAHGFKCGEKGYCSDECMAIGAFKRGAAAMGGVIGMAEAIRTTCVARQRRSAADERIIAQYEEYYRRVRSRTYE